MVIKIEKVQKNLPRSSDSNKQSSCMLNDLHHLRKLAELSLANQLPDCAFLLHFRCTLGMSLNRNDISNMSQESIFTTLLELNQNCQ